MCVVPLMDAASGFLSWVLSWDAEVSFSKISALVVSERLSRAVRQGGMQGRCCFLKSRQSLVEKVASRTVWQNPSEDN